MAKKRKSKIKRKRAASAYVINVDVRRSKTFPKNGSCVRIYVGDNLIGHYRVAGVELIEMK